MPKNTAIRPIPRVLLNLALTAALVAVIRFYGWHYFDAQFSLTEMWPILGVGTTVSFLSRYLPKSSKDWLPQSVTRTLSKPLFTKLLTWGLAVSILIGLLFSVVKIEHRVDRDTRFWISDQEVDLSIESPDYTLKRGLSFTKTIVRCGNFNQTVKFLPFNRPSISIPFQELVTESPEIETIEKELAKTLFQFAEYSYFAKAKLLIEAEAGKAESKMSIERVALIQQILELSFVGPDPSGSADTLLERFKEKFAGDSWNSLLESVIRYGKKDYLAAAKGLADSNPDDELLFKASAFFRGVCMMKAALGLSDAAEKDANFTAANKQFIDVEKLLESSPPSEFRSLGYGSSLVFQAILAFYKKDLEGARSHFRRAAGVSASSLKARAMNGIGFTYFIEGRLDDAELALLSSLEADKTFPFARSNYGYVLLARNKPEEAIKYFTSNANDTTLLRTSRRDVLLAKLAIVHAEEIMGRPAEQTIKSYAAIMNDSGFRDFEGVTPDQLRLANLYYEMADKVYTGKDYYGLEPFALALLGKSTRICHLLKASMNEDSRLVYLQSQIAKSLEGVSESISPDWFNSRNRGKFFADVNELKSPP